MRSFAIMRALGTIGLVCVSPSAHAHAEAASAAADAWLAAVIALSLLLYLRGAWSLWHAAPGHRRTLPRYAVPFALGWALLALALLPPLASVSAETFSGHMLQHEVLMVAAAPLLVLGRPLAVWAWAFPPGWRPYIGRPARWRRFRAAWAFLTAPLTATIVHAIALWLWHAPPLFAAARADIWVHALQHAAFFFTAVLFWNAVFNPRERTAGASLLWLFVTMLHTGALGVLLTFSAGLWYPDAPAAAAWGLTPLEDQQFGGLIMWVPGGTVYVIAAVALAARWLSARQATGEA
jgi:putative membrane protein